VAAGPLEQFSVHPMVPFRAAGYDLSFTNASLFMVITLGLVWIFLTFGMRRAALIPGRWQGAVESLHEFVTGMVRENIGPNGLAYVPFIFALFIFILFANLLGLLPFAFTVTSHLAVTAAFSLFIFALCLLIGFARHGLKFLTLFVPPQTPVVLLPLIVLIEFISYLARPLTLAVRLFANMTAGHILLQVFAGFIIGLGVTGGFFTLLGILPLFMNVALFALELLVSVVQAYVFALLTCVYLNDSINLPH
jgi:F-type H+-transporting ATPase subunit a